MNWWAEALRFILGVALLLGGLGCSESADETTSQAPVVQEAKAPEVTDEQRRTRFEKRPSIALPTGMPRTWQTMVKNLKARISSVRFTRRSHAASWRGATQIELKFRMFGRDDEIDARILASLQVLKLPGLNGGLPENEVEEGEIRWSIQIGRLVAPPGAMRESRVELKWARQPLDPKNLSKCRKPAQQEVPKDIAGWLTRVTAKRTTRRRIEVTLERTTRHTETSIKMLYRNGFAHDENVGQIMGALKASGFVHQSGSGPRQSWSLADGTSVDLSPVPDDLKMGCLIKGPVLEIILSRAKDE